MEMMIEWTMLPELNIEKHPDFEVSQLQKEL